MDILFINLLFLPFLISLLLLTFKKNSFASESSLGRFVFPLIWFLFTLFFTTILLQGDDKFLSLSWIYSGHLPYTMEMHIIPLRSVLIAFMALLLLLNLIFINTRGGGSDTTRRTSLFFIMTGLGGWAVVADSIYLFFILSEVLFLIHFLITIKTANSSSLGRMVYCNIAAQIILILVMLEKGRGGILPFSLDLVGIGSYFAIKLFLLPLSVQGSIYGKPIEQVLFIIFIHGFKKYVVDAFPQELIHQVLWITTVCAVIHLFFYILAARSNSIEEKQSFMLKALAALMIGAFFSFNMGVHVGIFTLLIGQVLSLFALFVLFSRSKGQKSLFFLVLYTLSFLPLSSNFIGFYKIILGYKSIHLYPLLIIFAGFFFLLLTLIKMFSSYTSTDGEKSSAGGIRFIAWTCLAVNFLMGLFPSAMDRIIAP